jgi:hypothetical protein
MVSPLWLRRELVALGEATPPEPPSTKTLPEAPASEPDLGATGERWSTGEFAAPEDPK